MTTPKESTAGVDTSLWELKEEDINVRIWDFAGHTVTHAVHQFFLSERCLYIMVYDGRTEDRNRLKYWLDQMENYGGDSKAFILVNERDKHKIDIPINSLKEKYPIEKVYAFNVEKDREQLEAFRRDVADFIKNNPSWKNQEIPLSYYQVKEELEARFDPKDEQAGAEHITKADFIDIARKHQVEKPEKLLKDLHYLGVSLWYADMDEYETLVLNPEWISQGVYRIINWVSNAQTHTLTLGCFAKVFADNARYPADKHKFLFNLMKHYELAYETTGGSRLVIPHLLKEDQLADLPKFDVEDSLMLKYEADQALPPHTISRFIVRHNQQIQSEGDKMNVWRYGVILEDSKGSLALVREKDREISVSVKGNDKTAFISTLRESLNAIFESYKSKRPELVYRVIDNTLPQQELWLDERKIVNHVLNNQPYYNDITNQNLPLQPVINIYQIQVSGNQPVIIGGQDNRLIQNIFNFKDCNLELQGELTELSRKLKREGLEEDAIELVEAVEILEGIEGANKEEVKKKGIAKKLRRIVEDLGDDKSPLGKAIKGVRHGVDIAQDIGKQYNKIAQWLGMPQVPDLFLGGDGKE